MFTADAFSIQTITTGRRSSFARSSRQCGGSGGVVLSSLLSKTTTTTTSQNENQQQQTNKNKDEGRSSLSSSSSSMSSIISRQSFLSKSLATVVASATATAMTSSNGQQPQQAWAADADLTMFQMPSGLKYLDLEVGTGPTPEYGQLVSLDYKAFIKLPASKKNANPKPQQFDASSGYLHKHGNGRLIAGFDEGLHTMKLGGTRRIIVPPKLGYVSSGLGPMPEYPWDRRKLNNMLDQMVALRGGNVVFEVTLLGIKNDEADQGYYEDGSLTPQELDILKKSIQQQADKQAAAKRGE
eukprot:CAMPEP_0198139148 /NCGR_PEP_ID=MMETSP1443-20131203/2491_1 /TAXON_ID=186043 /ORGANISM="Entomoneis sp., Strain CCMP2396" /LENGTH=296 /DNA_ID=CAMNT_0043801191 /DNA_START=158 /DNA_END=1048 /DNA_ORIENTATION=+